MLRVWGAWVSPQESGAPAGVTQVNRTAAAGLACLCCPHLGKRAMPYRLCVDYLLYTTSTTYSSLEATWISEPLPIRNVVRGCMCGKAGLGNAREFFARAFPETFLRLPSEAHGGHTGSGRGAHASPAHPATAGRSVQPSIAMRWRGAGHRAVAHAFQGRFCKFCTEFCSK